MYKVVLVIVLVFIMVLILPQMLFAFLNALDGMLYVSFGILCHLMKLAFLMGIVVVPVAALFVVLIKKSHK